MKKINSGKNNKIIKDTTPPPPPPTEARFFVEPEKLIGSTGLAIDKNGGMHLAYDAAYNGRCWIDQDPGDNNPPEYLFWQIRHSVRVIFTEQP